LQTIKLEETLKREKDKLKSMDEELENLRDDNLKIKKDKKNLKLSSKTQHKLLRVKKSS
jgi:hypothetical protein